MVAKTGVAPVRIAATRHRERNQLSRGSLTTSSLATSKWDSNHCAVRIRSASRVATRPVSNQASGRASLTWTRASLSRRSWWATAHAGSLKPLGLVSSAATSGRGTCRPRICIRPAIVLVPLRPAPATNSTLRGYSSADGVTGGGMLGVVTIEEPTAARSRVRRMRWGRRERPLVSVVVPAYDVADYLGACLDSLLAQTHREVEVVVVDDGSPDASGEIADAYAARESRVRAVHTENRGLGAARNEGARHTTGSLLTFADSDDVVPRTAYADLVRAVERDGSDFATGSIVRWEDGGLLEPPWMRRLHRDAGPHAIGEVPELLGDVFAWNKLFRRDFFDRAGAGGLRWPEGVRYEDQPTTTRAFLAARRFSVLPEVVYHWRIRADGSSITQQRSSLADLTDRFATKRMSRDAVLAHGDAHVTEVFLDRVLAGDLHRYFAEIPGCSEQWWTTLRDGVRELWAGRSLTSSGLLPVHRLTGWLVEQDRREDAAAVMSYAATLGAPPARVQTPRGPQLVVPVVETSTIDPAALAVRPGEL